LGGAESQTTPNQNGVKIRKRRGWGKPLESIKEKTLTIEEKRKDVTLVFVRCVLGKGMGKENSWGGHAT